MHELVHDSDFTQKRGRLLLSRGMPVKSYTLGITGVCDMVELEEDPDGVAIVGRPGKYKIFPVEYKLGKPDDTNSDVWQLCAQAMCLEEMFCTNISEGAIYYARLRRRKNILLDDALRASVKAAISEMHQLMARRYTPKVRPKKACAGCSLHEICQPELLKKSSVTEYVRDKLSEPEE